MLIGTAGSGKSALASQYALAAAQRGERVAIFAFDESVAMFRARGRSMGMDLDRHMKSGVISIRQIDPAELSPGEFAHDVRTAVESQGAQLVVLDSLNGYVNAMPQEDYLALQLHELLAYLGQRGVLSIATLVQHGLLTTENRASVDVSYLADTVVLIRPFEAQGRVRKALSVLKKRSGPHENSIRELLLDSTGVRVGPVLAKFAGILTGAPQFLGRQDDPAEAKR
jgi:circadian clock protein KaiC